MKITAFVSSSSHNGNTATAAKKLLEGAKDAGAEIDICYLNDYLIKCCRGCRVCETTDECVIKDDDVHLIHEKLDACDAYVLATPTFYGDITGQFKVFVDRCYPYVAITKDPVSKKMSFGSRVPVRKPGVIIALSGTHGVKVFDSHLKVGYFALNDLNGYPFREVLIPNTTWQAVKDQPEKLAELYAVGKELAEHLANGGEEDKERTQKYFDHFRLLKDVTLPCFE